MMVNKEEDDHHRVVPMEDEAGSPLYDDDGRPKRTGTLWTASAHIITAVIGSGVLSLAWAMAQLGWIAGPIMMLLFSLVTYYTSVLLSACYRTGDPDTGKRNYTYMDAVRSNLGSLHVKACGVVQYVNLFGVAIGYTIASSISMMAVQRSNCFHSKGDDATCKASSNPYMIAFGIVQIIFSQIPDFDQIWWLSIVAAVMSFTYSTIGLGLGVAKVAENGRIGGSLSGISVGPTVTSTQKAWRSFQALGAIAFAYSYSMILIEIQDTVKSPPPERRTMKKATAMSVVVTTLFYMLCGCFGYAAFGDSSPGNLLTGFGFYNPYWLLDVANVAIVVHLVGAYQVFSQPLFAFIEKTLSNWFPNSRFMAAEISIPIPIPTTSKPHRDYRLAVFRLPGSEANKFALLRFPGGFFEARRYKVSPFRLVWRSLFVVLTTVISMLLPFFNDVVGILGALGFWPLTVYFPVEMYIKQKGIPKWGMRWICLQTLSGVCFVISVLAAVGSVAGVVADLKVYKPFKGTS